MAVFSTVYLEADQWMLLPSSHRAIISFLSVMPVEYEVEVKSLHSMSLDTIFDYISRYAKLFHCSQNL